MNNALKRTVLWSGILLSIVGLMLTLGLASSVMADDGDNHSIGSIKAIQRNGNKLQIQIIAPSEHRLYSLESGPISDRDDCDEDTDTQSITLVSTEVGSKRTTGLMTIVADVTSVTKDSLNDYDGKYVCLKVVYRDRGVESNDRSTDHDEVYLVSNNKMDLKAPEIKKNGITIEHVKYDATMVGKDMKIMVEFNESVEVTRTAAAAEDNPHIPTLLLDYAGTPDPADDFKFKLVANNKYKKDDVIATGNTLVFEREVQFYDGYIEIEDPTIKFEAASVANVSFIDKLGNATVADGTAAGEDLDQQIIDENDIDDTIVDMTPIITIVRSGIKLTVLVNPSKYDGDIDGDDSRDDDTVENWEYVVANSDPGNEDCLEIEPRGKEEDDDYISGTDNTGIDEGTLTLPASANDKYYCFIGTLNDKKPTSGDIDWSDREDAGDDGDKVFSDWYKYRIDAGGPTFISALSTEGGKQLVISTSDVSGVKSIAWRAIEGSNSRCISQLTFGNDLDIKTADGVTTAIIAVNADLDGLWVCIRATDNIGKHSVIRSQLQLAVPPQTVNPNPVPTTPTSTTPIQQPTTGSSTGVIIQPVGEDDASSGSTTNTVSLPADWDQLSGAEKTAANPYKCLDTTKIRADNGQCISGGSALGDDVTVGTSDTTVVNPVEIASEDTTDIVLPGDSTETTEEIPTDSTATEDSTETTEETSTDSTTEEGSTEVTEETPTDSTATEETSTTEDSTEVTEEDEGSSFPIALVAIIVVVVIVIIVIIVITSRRGNQYK